MAVAIHQKVASPEGLAIQIAKRHFPFLLEYIQKTGMYSYNDVKNIGVLCSLQYQTYKEVYNAIQRELYSLSKSCGFRRTRKNNWIAREVDAGYQFKMASTTE